MSSTKTRSSTTVNPGPAYESLPPGERWMVQVLSVMYEPTTRTALFECVRKARVRTRGGRAFTAPELKALVRKFIGLGIVTEESSRLCCHLDLVELATREAVREGHFKAIVGAIRAAAPSRYTWGRYLHSFLQGMRDFRIAVYAGDVDGAFERHSECWAQFPSDCSLRDPFVRVSSQPFDAAWVGSLPTKLSVSIIMWLMKHSLDRLEPADGAFEMAWEYAFGGVEEESRDTMVVLVVEQAILRGKFDLAREGAAAIERAGMLQGNAFVGWLDVIEGHADTAPERFRDALKRIRKATGKRKVCLHSRAGLFHVLALVASGTGADLREAADYVDAESKRGLAELDDEYNVLSLLVAAQGGAPGLDFARWPSDLPGGLVPLLAGLASYWTDRSSAAGAVKRLRKYHAGAKVAGYRWLAAESADLLARLVPGDAEHAAYGRAFREETGTRALADLLGAGEPWERSLAALIRLDAAPDGEAPGAKGRGSRLAWVVELQDIEDPGEGMYCSVKPIEQKRTARGGWTKGRAVSLKRLRDEADKLDYLTEQDRKVCACVREESEHNGYGSYYSRTSYRLDLSKALPALAGHPHLFRDDTRSASLELTRGEPELRVVRNGDGIELSMFPPVEADATFAIVREGPARFQVVEFGSAHRKVAMILKGGSLSVPAEASDRVARAIAAVSSVLPVHSDIAGAGRNIEQVPADPRPHVHLLPAGAGLKAELLVRPLAAGGPCHLPGQGGETVIAEIDGKRLGTRRDLAAEAKRAGALVAACQTLQRSDAFGGQWTLDDPEDCLELLGELQALGDAVVVEWPRGQKFRVTRQASLKQFSLTIRKKKDWFEADGRLEIDDGTVLAMSDLLNLLEGTPGRFLPLKDGQFLALTREFRQRLDELRAFSQPAGEGVRFHPLAALALSELTEQAGSVQASSHWRAHVKRLREGEALRPEAPSTLRAELRDYQHDGFSWLVRLAHWGVGACLADDMGLGKTVQALAAILTRAPDGPTLVVAPTSVCANWEIEAGRFAPTLNVIRFGGGDRRETVESLGPFDLLVCSYGLLHHEADLLAEASFRTVVLDEAQAIKNVATKRSKAAMGLKGEFKIITTGTPIENHLGELWNLFRFLNPGLLGSLESFNRRFAVPIQRDNDAAARGRLRKLLHPFILRRKKDQVLEELPSRTEILVQVELSEAERAFYEALRRKAVGRLAESDASVGQRNMRILAEIMTLRRACCNARLVAPETSLPSAKLAVFGERLTELIENRHKALVFSQFVGHLAILREYLDGRGVTYQYLDGSTSVRQRQKRIDAFQSGHGDVFLISLRAGGLGLNLTAADYVIHMDPWWNPAVEDQASDRAHRIGQKRPVTIYRLVAKGTIEEKIVELHRRKRDLADGLLKGSDLAGKISPDELLQMLQESAV